MSMYYCDYCGKNNHDCLCGRNYPITYREFWDIEKKIEKLEERIEKLEMTKQNV